MKYLIVVPARGGSKGIPNKNIYPLLGKPLLEYTLEVAINLNLDKHIAVSTDSEQIAKVAENYSEVDVVERPPEISGDHASTEAALLHALSEMQERKGIAYDAVITLQPTSPLRKDKTVEQFIECFENHISEYDACLSLTETRSDYWVCDNNRFHRLFPDAPRRRQERDPLFIENSCIYVTTAHALIETNSVLGHRVNGFVIPEVEGIDINEPNDLVIAESYLKINKN